MDPARAQDAYLVAGEGPLAPWYARRVYYREQPPSAALGSHVEAYWSIDGATGAPAHRVLPDGCIDLLFDGAAGARVIGPMTRAIVAPPVGPRATLFGVRFHPGQAAPFLGVAARDLRDRTIAIQDVWGSMGRALVVGFAETRG